MTVICKVRKEKGDTGIPVTRRTNSMKPDIFDCFLLLKSMDLD